MKTKFTTLMMAFAIFFTMNVVTANKAEALVGFAFKSKVIKTLGAVSTGGGVGIFGLGVLIAKVGSGTAALGWAIITLVYGPIIAAVGLVLLDDNTVVDLEYQPIDLLDTQAHSNFSLEEIQMYNAELEELNAVRKTIQSEVSDEGTTLDNAKALWDDYSQALHPSTIKVAEKKAAEFINTLKAAHKIQ